MTVQSGPGGETGKKMLSGKGGTGTGMPEVDGYAAGRKAEGPEGHGKLVLCREGGTSGGPSSDR